MVSSFDVDAADLFGGANETSDWRQLLSYLWDISYLLLAPAESAGERALRLRETERGAHTQPLPLPQG